MGRTRKGTVVETTEELETLLGRFNSSPYEPRIRFLLALKEDPLVKSEVLVGELGLSDRTIRRWWNAYKQGGLTAFLDHPSMALSVAEESADYADPGATALMELLNSMPVSCEAVQWRTAVESALARYLTGVDRVDIVIPSLGESFVPTVPGATGSRPGGDRILDLPVGEEGSLGRLLLHAGPGESFDEALVLLEELEPFLSFLYTDAIARLRAVRPESDADQGRFLTGPLVKSLSPRERDVLMHRLYGYSYSEAAERLGVSEETIRKCVKSIYRKTNTSSIGELFVRYFSSIEDAPDE